jgi:Protein of unknown function (DUF4089)
LSENNELDAFIACGTRLLELTVQPEWRDEIRLHLAVSLDHARTVAEFPLPDETDLASIFRA